MAVNQFIVIGKITSAHGIRGEVKVYPLTDDPKRFLSMKDCHISGEDGVPVSDSSVENARIDKTMVIVKLEGVNDRNAAEADSDDLTCAAGLLFHRYLQIGKRKARSWKTA